MRWTILSTILATILPLSDGLTKVAALAKNGERADTIPQDSSNEVVKPDQSYCVPIACPSGVCYNGSYPYTGCTYGGGYSSGSGYGYGGGSSCVPIACPSGVCYNGSYPYTGCTYGGGYSSGSCAGYGGGYSGCAGGGYSGGCSGGSVCEGGVSPKQRTGWKRSWSQDGRPL